MELFRDYLDNLCHSRRILYAELAREIGVTKSYIGQLVHGHSKPPPRERCEQIAEALDLSPAERRRLLDLAIRERARNETRVHLEELSRAVEALSESTGQLLTALVRSLAAGEESLPEPVADLVASNEVLADLYTAATSDNPEAAQAAADRLAELSPERLATELDRLAAALQAEPARLEPAEGAAGVAAPRPPIPVIGYVAAGETDVAFTDAGLPEGASLPGEDPIPRWPGIGEHAYALRITGESMTPLCPPGTTIIVDPERTPREGEAAICQTTEDKSYFKIVHFESGGSVRLKSTNEVVAPDIVLQRPRVRRLQKVVATLYH
ncbi:MAG: XRE family transcriptional regulator [Planctomycetota bacterium]